MNLRKSRHQAIHGIDVDTGEYVYHGSSFDPIDDVTGKRVPDGRGIYQFGRYIDPRDRFSREKRDPEDVWLEMSLLAFDSSLGYQTKPASFYDDW